MKKLSTEEKAKSCDEVVERAKKVLLDCTPEERKVVEYIFPELKESEDEIIRKEMLQELKDSEDNIILTPLKRKRWISWLEKQEAIDILDEEEREFADNVDSYRKEIDAAYQTGYNEGVKATLKKQGEQKSEWTPMDEQHVENLLAIIEGHGYPGEVAWLNSLEDRIQPKHNEQKTIKEHNVCDFCEDRYGCVNPCPMKLIEAEKSADKVDPRQKELTKFEKAVKQVMEEAIECGDTHNLKADADMLLSLVQKSVWSEEDESMYIRTLGILAKCYMGELPTKVEEELNWFKSLRPQNTWKPSDEQMEALWEVYKGGEEQAALASLYSDLKTIKL